MSITNVSTLTTLPNPYAGSAPAGGAQGAPTNSATAVPPASAVAKAKPADRAEVEDAVKHIEEFVRAAANNLQFSIDEATGITVVKVTDARTQEVIRQIPSDEILAIARALDRFHGLLIESEA